MGVNQFNQAESTPGSNTQTLEVGGFFEIDETSRLTPVEGVGFVTGAESLENEISPVSMASTVSLQTSHRNETTQGSSEEPLTYQEMTQLFLEAQLDDTYVATNTQIQETTVLAAFQYAGYESSGDDESSKQGY